MFRSLLLALALLATALSAPAENLSLLPDPPLIPPAEARTLAARATTEAYPDADVVAVADYTRVVYEPDGTSVEINEEYTRILTEKGRREVRTRTYGFMAHYGRVDILLAEIVKPDGTRIPVDIAAQSREMIDPSQMGSNIYDPNQKRLTLTLPGLEIGDMTHLVVARRTTKARVPDTWSDYSVFEHTSPILSLVYEVQAPKERPLSVIRLRDELPGTVTYSQEANDTGVLHRWTVRDVPQAFAEPSMPAMYTVVQRLLVSTISDWKDISRWYWNLSAPRIAATSDDMRVELTVLLDGAETRDEKIRRIFTFVSQKIRYMGITPEEEAPGYEPHDVSMTFANRYGVCRDKAALLVALLRMADIPAYPVLVHVGPRKDAEVPQPFFNHAIVAVEREDARSASKGAERYLLMDPTDENTRDLLPGYLRNKSFLVAHPEGEILLDSGPAPAEDNLVRITSEGSLDANDTLTLESTIRFEGVNDNAYRAHLLRLKPEERRRFFEGLVRARVSGATLSGFSLSPEDLRDTTQPLEATLRSVSANYPIRGDGARILELPWFGGAVGYVNWVIGRTGLTKRRFPLDTDPTCGVEETVTLHLGSNFPEALSVPGKVHRENSGLLFVQDVSIEGESLTASSRFLVRAAEFSPEQYLELREELKEMEVARRRRPLFEAGAANEEADIRVLERETTVELTAAGAWSTTTRSRTQILTYAGKKANSELKIGYNPVWQTLEVRKAKVSAPDGVVRETTDQEHNLMDAAWVGGAPRYPAEKTLVVSLPGVEIGSVIETEVVVTQQDAPFFSLRTGFQGFEPMEQSTLDLLLPAGLKLSILEPEATPSVPIQREQFGDRELVRHRWSTAGVPAVEREDNLPPSWTYLPTLLASTGDWNTYGMQLARRIEECTNDQPQSAAKAGELVQKIASSRDRVIAIRNYVSQNIRVAGPAFTELPLASLTPADTTLRDGYGHRADQAILLLAMLKAAGITAEPLLVAGGAPVLPSITEPLRDIPQRSFYDTLLVQVRLENEGIVLLNDTDHYAELGTTPHEGRPSMTLEGAQGVVEATEWLKDRGAVEWILMLAGDGTTHVTMERQFFGDSVNGFRRSYSELPPEERRRHHQELIAAVSQSAEADGGLVTELKAYPGVMRFAASVPRYAIRDGATLQVLLPGIEENLLGLRSEKRSSPLYRGRDSRLETLHRLHFPPESLRILVSPPSSSEFEFPGGFGTVIVERRTRRLEDGTLEIELRRSVRLRSTVASSELYPALLAMNRHLQHPRFRTLLVELKPEEAPAAKK